MEYRRRCLVLKWNVSLIPVRNEGFVSPKVTVLVTSAHYQILTNATKQSFDTNPKMPIYRTARVANNCVIKMCERARRGATARCLASWHAGCHSCYEKPGQRWVARTIRSNCARELHRRSRWAGSGGARAVTLGASLQQNIRGGVMPVLKWWLYRIFFGQLHILWLHEELYENDAPKPKKDRQKPFKY